MARVSQIDRSRHFIPAERKKAALFAARGIQMECVFRGGGASQPLSATP
jgi:hypothetical protein